MKKIILAVFVAVNFGFCADEYLEIDLDQALQSKFIKKVSPKLGVEFVWGEFDGEVFKRDNDVSKRSRKYREEFTGDMSEKIEFPKEVSCNFVLSSVMAHMAKLARKARANKVVNIRYNFAGKDYQNPSKFQCVCGNSVTAVSMRADFAK